MAPVDSFSPDTIAAVVTTACDRVGVACSDPTLIRLGENLLYELASVPPIVVRVGRQDRRSVAEKEVAIARWLQQHPIAAAEIVDLDAGQPLVVDRYPVTFWRYIAGAPGQTTDAGLLGEVLRELHRLPAPEFALAPVAVFDRTDQRLRSAPISQADRDALAAVRARVGRQLEDLQFPNPPIAVHGDAHVKNLMITDDGPVLIDFEAFAFGPPEWDLAKTAAEHSVGMISDSEYDAFVSGYGRDVADWVGFPAVRDAVLLNMTTWLAQNVAHDGAIAAEYAKRVETLRTGVLTAPWQGF